MSHCKLLQNIHCIGFLSQSSLHDFINIKVSGHFKEIVLSSSTFKRQIFETGGFIIAKGLQALIPFAFTPNKGFLLESSTIIYILLITMNDEFKV